MSDFVNPFANNTATEEKPVNSDDSVGIFGGGMSDESIFGDLDVAAAADSPWDLLDGTYGGVVTECKAGPTAKGDKKGLTIVITVDESSDPAMVGRKNSEWLEIPRPADPKNPTPEEAQATSRLKARLLSLGIPQDRINQFKPSDVMGLGVIFRLGTTSKNGRDFQNIKELKVREVVSAGNPFASN